MTGFVRPSRQNGPFFAWCRLCAALLAVAGLAVDGLRPVNAQMPGRDLLGHGGPVRAIDIAPDGMFALTGSFDYSVIFWETGPDGPVLKKRFLAHDAAVSAVRFVPRSWFALSGSDDGTLALWNLHTLKLERRKKGHGAKIAGLAVSPDGALAATAGWDKVVRIWDVATLEVRYELKGHRGNVNAVAFSRDGSILYSADTNGRVLAWQAGNGAGPRVVYNHGWGINVLAALPQKNRLLIGALNGDVRIIDTVSGEIVRTLARHDRPVLSAVVSARHGLVAVATGGGQIRVWSTGDWGSLGALDYPYGPVWALGISGDGTGVYYAGLGDAALYWQVTPRRPFETVRSEIAPKSRLSANAGPGEKQFVRKCSICHTLSPDGGNRAGPTLYKVFGRRAGTLAGYPFSDALKRSTIVWNEETIARLFYEGPAEVVPGTKMPLQRMTNPEERDALVAFLKEATQSRATPEKQDQEGSR